MVKILYIYIYIISYTLYYLYIYILYIYINRNWLMTHRVHNMHKAKSIKHIQ